MGREVRILREIRAPSFLLQKRRETPRWRILESIATKITEDRAMQSATHPITVSKGRIWTGRVLSALAVLFLTFDAVTKIIKDAHVIQASARLEFSVKAIFEIGIILLICTVLYVIPKTSVLGAVLLTGYLGGAVA